jgi:ethanolamine ammonia-lyase large subunit
MRRDGTEEVVRNITLCWRDMAGISLVPARMSLRDLLKDDILNRYDNEEYYFREEGDSDEDLTNEILDRYNNIEYWDIDIVRDFVYEKYLSEDDIDIIRYVLPDDEVAEMLLLQKNDI